jgi:hypothetical protein
MTTLIAARHLWFIADTLKASKPMAQDHEDAAVMWRNVVLEFCKACARANPKFKEHLFLKACDCT